MGSVFLLGALGYVWLFGFWFVGGCFRFGVGLVFLLLGCLGFSVGLLICDLDRMLVCLVWGGFLFCLMSDLCGC